MGMAARKRGVGEVVDRHEINCSHRCDDQKLFRTGKRVKGDNGEYELAYSANGFFTRVIVSDPS